MKFLKWLFVLTVIFFNVLGFYGVNFSDGNDQISDHDFSKIFPNYDLIVTDGQDLSAGYVIDQNCKILYSGKMAVARHDGIYHVSCFQGMKVYETFYDANYTLRTRKYFENGIPAKKYYQYDENGNMEYLTNFTNGEKYGNYIFYKDEKDRSKIEIPFSQITVLDTTILWYLK